MKFNILRCLGILFVRIATLYLAVIQSPLYQWEDVFSYLFDSRYIHILGVFVIGLIGAAVSFSLKEES